MCYYLNVQFQGQRVNIQSDFVGRFLYEYITTAHNTLAWDMQSEIHVTLRNIILLYETM